MRTVFLVIFFQLLLVPMATADYVRFDAGDLTVCPARSVEVSPPSFTAADCRAIDAEFLDPQHTTLWVRATAVVPPEMLRGADPLGLFISAKAASRIWLNGTELGQNGVPGLAADTEAPGRMDAVIYLPRERVRAGENELVVLMSGHHSLIQLRWPLHYLGIGTYVDPGSVALKHYWPSFLPFGAFLIGVIYFAVMALRRQATGQSVLLCLLSLFAAGQSFSELARSIFSYAYPVQDIRLFMNLVFSAGFSLSLAAHVIWRFAEHRKWYWLGFVVVVMLACVFMARGYDSKAIAAVFVPVVLCAAATGYLAWRGRQYAARYTLALALFAALIIGQMDDFLEGLFAWSVGLLLAFLFVQQALGLADVRALRQKEAGRARQLELALAQAREAAGPKKISIRSAGKIDFVSTDQLVHCQGAGDYVELKLAGAGAPILHSGTLAELEATLPETFLRVHRSHIVNTAFIRRLQRDPSGTGLLELAGGHEVPVSRRILPQLRDALA